MSYITRGMMPPEILMDIQKYYFEEEDFTSGAVDGSLNWTAALGGGAAIANATTGINTTSRCIGTFELSTGGVLGGSAALVRNLTSMLLGFTAVTVKTRVIIPTLSSLLQRFTIHVGLIDSTGAGDSTDAVYFRYQDNEASGNWQTVTINNGARTATNTGIAATTSVIDLEFRIDSAGSAVQFLINDTNLFNHTTNIPTGAGRFLGPGWKIEKNLGLSARSLIMDYYSLLLSWDTPR